MPEDTYQANTVTILDDLLGRVARERIVSVGIPDYTVTPQGAAFGDPARQSLAIRRNNTIMRELAAARRITFVDVYDVSIRAGDDRTLVADDGLHPSGAQYALWVDRIAPVVARLVEA